MEKSTFSPKKHVFFHKTQLWLPRGPRPLRVPLLMPLSICRVFGNYIFCESHTCELYKNKIGKIAQERPPNEFFCTFSGTRLFNTKICKIAQERLFCNVKKWGFKSSCTVRGMGPPQGSAFACTATRVNRTKKQK